MSTGPTKPTGRTPPAPTTEKTAAASLFSNGRHERTVRILIADDHPIMRVGAKALLTQAFPQAEFELTGTVRETLESLSRANFDLLVLDLFMPDGNGLQVLQEVLDSHPGVPVLVFSSAAEEQSGLRIMRAGASGYLDKQKDVERLADAARNVLGGGKYLSASLVQQMAAELTRDGRSLHEKLSAREFQILRLVVTGQCLKSIAVDLALSVKTVRTYHARLLSKLRLQSDVALVHYAFDHHLVEKNVAPVFPKMESQKS